MTRNLVAGTILACALALTGCGGDADDPAGSEGSGGNQSSGRTGGEQSGGGETDGDVPDDGSKGSAGSNGSDGSEDSPGAPSSFEGTWYAQDTQTRKIGTIIFRGSDVTMNVPDGPTCEGTFDEPKVNLTCPEQAISGEAHVTEGGQKLVIWWDGEGGQDDFTREKPTP